jgi:hypothetical protein
MCRTAIQKGLVCSGISMVRILNKLFKPRIVKNFLDLCVNGIGVVAKQLEVKFGNPCLSAHFLQLG